MPWEEIVAGFVEPIAGSRVDPVPSAVEKYKGLAKLYSAREAQALQ